MPLALALQNGKNNYYKSMNAIVSEKGQVTIPKPIRDDLGLEAGSILAFAEDEGRIIVTKYCRKIRFPLGAEEEFFRPVARSTSIWTSCAEHEDGLGFQCHS